MKPRTPFFFLVLLLLLLGAGAGNRAGADGRAGDGARDRLDQFRVLAGSHLASLDLGVPGPSSNGLGEIYALLDQELIDNLNSGPLFSSQEFLQERLNGFSEVWGGSAFQVLRLPGEVTVGIFRLTPGGGSSVRVYSPAGDRFELGQVIVGPGSPMLFPLLPARSGAGQFFLVWVGSQTPRRSVTLQVDVLRLEGNRLRSVWSTAGLFRDELIATRFVVQGQDVTIRYELRYPGWKSGCPGQTEQEDLYRYAPDGDGVILARRQTINPWHRELHSRAVSPLLHALAEGDRQTLARLVPDPALRARLPGQLLPDPACDAPDGPHPSEARVSAVAAPDRRSWDLRFRQLSGGWHLTDAAPAE